MYTKERNLLIKLLRLAREEFLGTKHPIINSCLSS